MSIHKRCVNLIKERKGQVVDLDKIPYDEPETMEVFARGDTEHVFQFDSDGMKRWLVALKPKCLDDLVAMNALYRPGPIAYIPTFVRRKNGEAPVAYDHPLMEEELRETYGVTIYQEQIMILSRKLAGFTRGESDKLRKAMGKKSFDVMEDMKGYENLRYELCAHRTFPQLAEDVADFCGRALIGTTDMIVGAEKKKELVRHFCMAICTQAQCS